MKEQVAIAKLASRILGEPERFLEYFSEFFQFGITLDGDNKLQNVDSKIRNLALLSATAVIVDILPSLVMNDTHEENSEEQKSTKDRYAKQKLAGKALEYYDELLQKMSKCKLVRGPSALLNSGLCSLANLGQERLNRLVSTVVSLACLPGAGADAVASLKRRIEEDTRNQTDNLDIVRQIVSSICKEKISDRLALLLPVLDGLRLRTISEPLTGQKNGKIDRELARDLATGKGDFVDFKKCKQNVSSILSDIIALFVRVLRGARQYSPNAIRIAIEGISQHAGSVNADLAKELETELLNVAKHFLHSQQDGVLGATALAALLSISKGLTGSDKSAVLSNSIVCATETLVPVALNQLILSPSPSSNDTLTNLCKGAISVAAQWGSDHCLLLIARALLTCLCLRFDDKSKLVCELLIHVAGRSPLVRTALDPDGVLVDSEESLVGGKVELSFYHQLVSLMKNFGPDPNQASLLLAHLGKHCKELGASQVVIQAQKREADTSIVLKKRQRQSRP